MKARAAVLSVLAVLVLTLTAVGTSPATDPTDVVLSVLSTTLTSGTTATTCDDHHDCEQGAFCHRGECRFDEDPVYHCGKPGCPPGNWCVEADGRRSTCAADPEYICGTACDCGPGHCCKDGTCLFDTDDP